MRRQAQTRGKDHKLHISVDWRGRNIQRGRLAVVGLFTILFAALTQTGCVGLTSAGNPFAKNSSTSTSSTGTNSPTITNSPLPNAQLGIHFQQSLTAAGGVQPYSWSIASGTLPSGITLNTATGILSGMPSQGGQFDFSAQVSDSSSPTPQTAMKTLALSVLAFTLQISPGTLPTGQVGVPFQTTFLGDGGVTPYTWTVLGSLPSGLTLNPSSGTLSGTPKLAETSTFSIGLTDSTGESALMTSSIMISAAGRGGGPVISPATPVVNQGATLNFTCVSNCGTGGTWSVSGTDGSGNPTTGAGTINPSAGVYTAPAMVKAQQTYGGYQLLPNNHIFNTRIDSLPVNPHSAAWIAGAGTVPFNYYMEFPLNYIDASTLTQNMHFKYTPANNGTFPVPPYPTAKIQCGAFTPVASCDHHDFAIDATGNGVFQELYDVTALRNIPGCPTCNAVGGVRYLNSAYALPPESVNAAGTTIMPLEIKLQELEQALATGGTINHAITITLSNGYICRSSTANACGGNAVGTRHIWPATLEAFAGGGIIPYGARFRLKSSFNISGYSAIAQILLKQLQQYGVILTDGGYGWLSGVEHTTWPISYSNALYEITRSGIATSNWEAVDESGLMVSNTSGITTVNREIVSYTSSTGKTSVDVALQGVAVNMARDAMTIQAGTPGQQLKAYVNIGTATWTMSPMEGTLTPSGFYTPPADVSGATDAIVTATSTTNPSVAAVMTLHVLPAGPIHVALGDLTTMGYASPYIDTLGNAWQEVNISDCTLYSGNSGGTWPAVPNIALYRYSCYGPNDIRIDLTVPNGTYQVTAKVAEAYNSGTDIMDFEVQGQVVHSNLNLLALGEGVARVPLDFTLPAIVTNGTLSFVVRTVQGTPMLDSLQIVRQP